MSQAESKVEQSNQILDDGFSKKPEAETKIVESALPEAPNTTKQIEDLLEIKKKMGLNLSDKETYSRIFNEIGEQVGCSYNNVKKVAKKYLSSTNQIIKESVIADKNKINIQGITDETRPPPRVPPKIQQAQPQKPLSAEQQKESDIIQIEFEAGMILMSFENIAGFQNMALGISPKSAKLKQMAYRIATFNQMMRSNGKPEEVINVGDKIMKYMLLMGLAGMFLMPLGLKIKEFGDKKESGIKPKKEKASMI